MDQKGHHKAKAEALASWLSISFNHCSKPRSLPFISPFTRPDLPVALRRLGRAGRGAGVPPKRRLSPPGAPRLRHSGRKNEGEEIGEEIGEEED